MRQQELAGMNDTLTDGTVLSTIKAPGEQPYGLTFDGECLWSSDRKDRKIYRINPESGKVLFSIAFDGDLTGTAWDGSHVWQSDQTSKTVSRINPETGSIEMAIKVDMPNGDLTGLCHVAEEDQPSGLWIGLSRVGQARKVKAEDGSFLQAYPTKSDICGVQPFGKHIYFTEPTTSTVHKMHKSAGSILMSYNIGGAPMGLTHDGEAFWVADQETAEFRRISF